jgi:hypothetical protein
MKPIDLKNLILEVYEEETLHSSRLRELKSKYKSEAGFLNEGVMDATVERKKSRNI